MPVTPTKKSYEPSFIFPIDVRDLPEEQQHDVQFLDEFGQPFPYEVLCYDPNSGQGIKREKGIEQFFFRKNGFIVYDGQVDPDADRFEAIKKTLELRKQFRGRDRKEIALHLAQEIKAEKEKKEKELKK